MDQVHVREGNSEVIIFIDRHLVNELETLKEASKAIQREVLRRESNPSYNRNWRTNNDIIPER